MNISCILLAAGDSTRMGRNKLLLEVNGHSLVKKTLKEINKIHFNDVIVVTGFEAEKIKKEIKECSHRIIHNPDYDDGMHTSIKTAVKNLKQETDAFFICLADQPFFDYQTLNLLMKKHEGGLSVPVHNNERGHPVLISSRFIDIILNEPDGDYGCAYLLKRFANEVAHIPVPTKGVLIDVDEPADYEKLIRDPVDNFYSKIVELRNKNESFAITSVVEVIGSASARTGSKAIFDSRGKNISGWIGGGCAERFIGEQSLEALKEKMPRTVLADLDDEIFGLGVACGGKMKVFIDPVVPMETVLVPFSSQFEFELKTLAGFYGWNLKFDLSSEFTGSSHELILMLARTIGKQRNSSLYSLREAKPVPARFIKNKIKKTEKIKIIGRSRITEALGRHFIFLGFNVEIFGPEQSYDSIPFRTDEMIIIASHTSQDRTLVKKAIEAKSSYVGMIGSLKRSHEILEHLDLLNEEVHSPLYIPAGLDIKAGNPDEIALSIAAEIVGLQES